MSGLAYRMKHGGAYLPAQTLESALKELHKKRCVCGWALPSKMGVSIIATNRQYLPNQGVMGVIVQLTCPSCGNLWKVQKNEGGMQIVS